MTLQQFLDGGGRLIPVATAPFTSAAFAIGYFANGRPHIHFRERYKTTEECWDAINELMKQYVSGVAR